MAWVGWLASRVFQAVARDNILPIGWLAKGSGKTDEPRRALLVSWILVQGCLLIPSLGIIANYASMFLLMAYTFTNLTCLVLVASGTPNFRPEWKYFNWVTALVGFLLCAGVMFLTNYEAALISTVLLIVLVLYIVFVRKPVKDWGHVSQALIYHQVTSSHSFRGLLWGVLRGSLEFGGW